MEWINIPTSLLRAPEYISSEPIERATWLSLLGWSCSIENGGVIKNCRQWKDRYWQQIAGVTLEEVHTPSTLWKWEGDDLILWSYPSDKQDLVQARRELGKKAGEKSAQARQSRTKTEPNGSTKIKPNGSTKSEPNLKPKLNQTVQPNPNQTAERKGREGKGKEWNGMEEKEIEENYFSPTAILNLYPRKERQREALEHIQASLDAGHPSEVIAAGTRAISAVISQLPSGNLNAYIPSAATFFQQERWMDDPQTWLRGAEVAKQSQKKSAPLDLGGFTPAESIEI